MNATLPQTLLDTLDFLMMLNREGTRPGEAKARLRSLQQQCPDAELDLLWEEESYDRSVHYDILLHLAREGTVSLSFCPDRALPWPMRGVQRWSEADLLRVNSTVLTIELAIAYLDFVWDESRIVNRLINVCLVQETLDKDPIELSDTELQRAMDGFRRAHKLYTTEQTYRWMEKHGMDHEHLEQYVADDAKVAKLRDRITADRIDDYFAAHRADFDTACIAQITFPDEQSAYQAGELIRSGAMDFYEAAQHQFLTKIEYGEQRRNELFSVVQRRQLAPEPENAIFSAPSGTVLGPLHTEEDYTLVHVLSVIPAHMSEQTQSAIKKILFDEWLAERRQAARIEWYWGNASQTSQGH
jgi:putative peptide maturation system protein